VVAGVTELHVVVGAATVLPAPLIAELVKVGLNAPSPAPLLIVKSLGTLANVPAMGKLELFVVGSKIVLPASSSIVIGFVPVCQLLAV